MSTSTVTINARDPKLTLRLERVLLAMEKRAMEERKLSYFAVVYRDSCTIEELEAWCAEFNEGSHLLPTGTVSRVKRELGLLASTGAPAAAVTTKTFEREVAPATATSPALRGEFRATAAAAPSAAAAAKKLDKLPPDDGASPWLKFPRGPQRRTLERFRVDLENLAYGTWGEDTIDGPLRSFLSHWLGSVRPAAAKVSRFLDWAAKRPLTAAKVAPPAAAPAPRPKPGRKAAKSAKFAGKQAAAPAAPNVEGASGEGWQDLEVRAGNVAAYDARYSGTGVALPSFSLTQAAARRLVEGMKLGGADSSAVRVSLRRHPQRGLVAIVPADVGGLKVRWASKGGARLGSEAIPKLLGNEVRLYRMVSAQECPGAYAVFQEVSS